MGLAETCPFPSKGFSQTSSNSQNSCLFSKNALAKTKSVCKKPPASGDHHLAQNTVERCSSSVVEHSLGKGEVESSILSCSTIPSSPEKISFNTLKANAVLGVLCPLFMVWDILSATAILSAGLFRYGSFPPIGVPAQHTFGASAAPGASWPPLWWPNVVYDQPEHALLPSRTAFALVARSGCSSVISIPPKTGHFGSVC